MIQNNYVSALMMSAVLFLSPQCHADDNEIYDYLYSSQSSQAEMKDEKSSVKWNDQELSSFKKSFGEVKSLKDMTSRYNSYSSGPINEVEVTAETYSNTQYDEIIKVAANKNGIHSELIKAVIAAESRFQPNAVSSKGAKGLMQLMDSVSSQWNIDPFNPKQNINVGTSYLTHLIHRFDNLKLALAAYNAGPGNVKKYGGIPPFSETQKYVSSIMGSLSTNVTANNGLKSSSNLAIR